MTLMNLLGEIKPPAQAAFFADTQWENPSTYKILDWLEGFAKDYDFPIISTTYGNLKEDTLSFDNKNEHIPFFTVDDNGKVGQLKRQCTQHYKIRPIHGI